MAEGFLKSFDSHFEVLSAGTLPTKKVNPYAIKVMQEAGIDISQHHPKCVDEFLHLEFDYVITVCDEAKESCPVFTGKVNHLLHKGFPDPAKAKCNVDKKLELFRKVRDEINSNFYSFYLKIK